MVQMKEQIKAPKTELSDEEIANLSDAQFKTLVIRMLTELVEFCLLYTSDAADDCWSV